MTRKLGLLCMSLFAGRGMIDSTDLKINSPDLHYLNFMFDFQAGGKLTMEIELIDSNSNHPLYLFLCTPLEKDRLNTFTSFDDFCQNPLKALACRWQGELSVSKPKANLDLSFDRDNTMELFAANCYNLDTYQVRVNSAARNPHGYLSSNDLPYLYIFPMLAAIWGCLLVFGLGNWIPYRAFNVSIHKLFTGVPVFHVINNLFATYYWQYCETAGRRPTQYNINYVLQALAESYEYLVLMYIAEGYGILRPRLKQATQVWSLVAVLALSTGLMEIDGDFLFFTIIMYLMVLRHIFKSHTESYATLSHQYMVMCERYPAHAATSPLYEKLQLYGGFQKTVVIYVGIDIVFRWWAKGLLLNEKWVERVVEDAITIFFLSKIAWSFRMRPFSPGFAIPIEDGMPRLEIPVWSPGMRVHKVPETYNDWLNSDIAELIIVEHPKRGPLDQSRSPKGSVEQEPVITARHYNIATWHNERLMKTV